MTFLQFEHLSCVAVPLQVIGIPQLYHYQITGTRWFLIYKPFVSYIVDAV